MRLSHAHFSEWREVPVRTGEMETQMLLNDDCKTLDEVVREYNAAVNDLRDVLADLSHKYGVSVTLHDLQGDDEYYASYAEDVSSLFTRDVTKTS